MTKPASVEVVPVYFRPPSPEDWSPRIRRGLEAARRLAGSLMSLEAIESVAGWPRSNGGPDNYAMLIPYWIAHEVFASGLLFMDPVNGVIDYHTWINEDGTLEVRELMEHPDPAVRVAVIDWASHELSDQEPGVCGFAGWRPG